MGQALPQPAPERLRNRDSPGFRSVGFWRAHAGAHAARGSDAHPNAGPGSSAFRNGPRTANCRIECPLYAQRAVEFPHSGSVSHHRSARSRGKSEPVRTASVGIPSRMARSIIWRESRSRRPRSCPPVSRTYNSPSRGYAVFTHDKHVSEIGKTIDTIWTQWLPDSGLKSAAAPCYEPVHGRVQSADRPGRHRIWVPIKS